MSGLSETILHLFIPDIIRAGGGWFLHGNQAEHLEQVVLHDIADRDKKGTGGHTKERRGENVMAVITFIKIITDHVGPDVLLKLVESIHHLLGNNMQ